MSTTTIQKSKPIKSNSQFIIIVSLVIIVLLYVFSTYGLTSIITSQKLQMFKMMFISIIIEAMPFILIGVFVSAIRASICYRPNDSKIHSQKPNTRDHCSELVRDYLPNM